MQSLERRRKGTQCTEPGGGGGEVPEAEAEADQDLDVDDGRETEPSDEEGMRQMRLARWTGPDMFIFCWRSSRRPEAGLLSSSIVAAADWQI